MASPLYSEALRVCRHEWLDRKMIDIVSDTSRKLARAWVWLGLMALIGSGLLAILLVFSRTPGIQDIFPLKEFFRAALVVHVDLSVAVWFMAFAAVIWSSVGSGALPWLGWTGLGAAAIGTLVMALSPFFPGAHPLLNNYIPVLQQPVFYASLWLLAGGFSLAVLRALLTIRLNQAISTGSFLGAVAAFLAFGAFIWSWWSVPRIDDDKFYHEVLFWGGGHALQFQHALLMTVAWFWIAEERGCPAPLSGRALSVLFWIAGVPLLAVPAIYLLVPAGSLPHMELFAKLMEWGHPYMGPLILVGLVTLWNTRRTKPHPARSAFLASFVLFAVGGVLGYMIRGANVVIPAHYHGSTVGVTLAFMGLAYVLLPKLGYGEPTGRLARWQAYVYGGGQLIHILGLAWSGGYGVQRKVAGAEQMLTTLPQKIGMGMMGLGGLIAVIGGIMFVVVCLKAMWPRRG